MPTVLFLGICKKLNFHNLHDTHAATIMKYYLVPRRVALCVPRQHKLFLVNVLHHSWHQTEMFFYLQLSAGSVSVSSVSVNLQYFLSFSISLF